MERLVETVRQPGFAIDSPMYKQHRISVVVPAYNEAGNVGTVIETVPEFVDRTYVVDDNSSDRTWQEITRAAEKVNGSAASSDGGMEVCNRGDETVDTGEFGAVVPIRHDHNRGVGGAITTGYERARGDGMDVAVVMAGDGQMDPDILPRILDPVVSGRARYSKGDRLGSKELVREMSNWRLFGNILLTSLTRIASGYWELSDPQNGYTALDLDILEEIELAELHQDYGFCNDLLVQLNAIDAPITDVPMRAKYGDERSGIRYSQFVPKLSWLLARDFLWRLRTSYLDTRDPLLFVLSVGLLCLPLSVLQIIRDLVQGDDAETVHVPPVFVIGAVLTTLALATDRQRNAGLVEKSEPKPNDS